MKCQCCGGQRIESIDGNFYAGVNIRYICHAGYGGQVMGCSDCGYMAVEFVHPDTVSVFYGVRAKGADGGLDPTRRQLDAIVAQGQCDLWRAAMGEARRILFYGAGRGTHAGAYTIGGREVHVRELFPGLNGAAVGNPSVSVLTDDDAVLEGAGSYDAVVLSNAFERLPFPRDRLSWCSHVLADGGLLFVEFPRMEPDLVRGGTFSDEEINFFTTESVGQLIAGQGSFAIVDSSLGGNPDGRQTIRAVLRNENRTTSPPSFAVDPEDMLAVLGRLNFACFDHAIGVARPVGAAI